MLNDCMNVKYKAISFTNEKDIEKKNYIFCFFETI